MRILECNYHESKSDRFQMEIIDETKDEYLVRLLPEWQDKMQEKDKVTKLRKCLVPGLYVVKEIEERWYQPTLF